MDKAYLSKALGSEVSSIRESELCSLWAGYGSIKAIDVTYRTKAASGAPSSVILKVVAPPSDSGEAHERKVTSYAVEASFYRHFAKSMKEKGVALADIYAVEASEDSALVKLLMSDLRQDYPIPGDGMLSTGKTMAAVDWLARFHALHWGHASASEEVYRTLWPEGCYWRLDTRSSEYEAIPQSWQRLKNCARVVADLLRDGTHPQKNRHKTIVHGDFKSANLQFAETSSSTVSTARSTQRAGEKGYDCAVVDFQYAGGGYGARDLVMLIASSVEMPRPYSHEKAALLEKQILEAYLQMLTKYLQENATSAGAAGAAVAAEYTLAELTQHYELSLVDYVRFMAGWGMWGNAQYAQSRAKEILYAVDGGVTLSPEEYSQRFRERYFAMS
jgi:thiamine kinase-like enzyme